MSEPFFLRERERERERKREILSLTNERKFFDQKAEMKKSRESRERCQPFFWELTTEARERKQVMPQRQENYQLSQLPESE